MGAEGTYVVAESMTSSAEAKLQNGIVEDDVDGRTPST